MIKITIAWQDLANLGLSDRNCDICKVNPYALKEGLVDYDDPIELTISQAKQLGIFNKLTENN